MNGTTTVFGSLARYAKGRVDVIDDDPKNYVFSNIFEVASRAVPYERVAVAKNFEYVIEAVRAEGASAWYAAAHDEFALVLDGQVTIELVELARPGEAPAAGSEGARKLAGPVEGRAMGRVRARRGHMTLLPRGAAYRFSSEGPGVLIVQTLCGPETVEKWAEICQVA
ncbi:MAG: hypothetical protein MUF34_13540 [Polyangiaceae bacterium]|jgi:hypothetical protein|nr:hypothetical protein [Polyangiaceae bacterium]